MFKLAVFCYSSPGHLNPTLSLAHQLKDRGYESTFFQLPHLAEKILEAGFDFYPLGTEADSQVIEEISCTASRSEGMEAMVQEARRSEFESKIFFSQGPEALRRAGIEGVMTDQALIYGAAVSERAGLPYVSIINALPLIDDDDVPSVCFGWGTPGSPRESLRQASAIRALSRIWYPVIYGLIKQRLDWGLGHRKVGELAQVTQCPAFLDFPKKTLPPNFHYTGPFLDGRALAPVPFPWERLDGRPLVYASLGTVVNRHEHIFKRVVEACAQLGLQAVITTGGAPLPQSLEGLPGDPVFVPFAPQHDLLKRASAAITHAGMNTALDCLTHGVPLVAIPLAFDQPGIAARLEHLKVGRTIRRRRPSAQLMLESLSAVIDDPQFRENAALMKERMRTLDGPRRAAEIIDDCFDSWYAEAPSRRSPDNH